MSETPDASVGAAPSPAQPYSGPELRALLHDPGRTFEVVLARRDRLAASIADSTPPWPLVFVLLLCTALATVPFGLVRGDGAWWKTAALLGGSVLLCVPSLQVFGAYLGVRMAPARTLAMSLVISSVAALFTLGFFPILWFLGLTMADGDLIDARGAALGMLAAAAAAGLLQFVLLARGNDATRTDRSRILLLVWQGLVVFVAIRMARALDLIG